MRCKFGALILIFNLSITQAWNLSPLNISEFSIIHVSVYYARAFISIRHHEELFQPTLIESSWPENIIGVKASIFPSEETHLRRSGKCKGIKQAIATDIDTSGRLWALDEGDKSCSVKLVIWDLLYFNNEVHFQAFGGLQGKKFSKLIIDPITSENGDTRAFIALKGEDYLLVYSMNERKLGKLKFANPEIQNPTKRPFFEEMTFSRKHDSMYVADTITGNLYSLNLTPIRFLNFSIIETKKLSIRSPLTFIGSLLGPPKDLRLNSKGNMFYIIQKFSTVAMWDPRTPLLAEWHEIIYQSSGNLTQLLCGKRGSVYVISENVVKIGRDGREKHSVKIHVE